MSWLEITALVLAFVTGVAAGSYLTFYSLLDMVMKIDDARAEGFDGRP